METGEFFQILIPVYFKLLKGQWDLHGVVYCITIIEQTPDRGYFVFKMHGFKQHAASQGRRLPAG
jgi:hypothetical protein